jgi:MFS family permease
MTTSRPPVREALSALKASPGFRRLFFARTVSVFGSQFTNVALAFAILAIPGTSTATLGLVFGSLSAATVIFLLLGGVLGDRVRRDVLIVISDLVNALAIGGTAFILSQDHPSITAICVLAAFSGAAVAVRSPALTALLPQVVEEEHLQSANALLRLTINTATLLGPAVAAGVFAATGAVVALSLDAASFALSALFIVGLKLNKPERSGHSMVTDLRHGWSAFVEHTWIWVVVAGFLFFNASANGVFDVLVPVVMRQHFNGASTYAALLTAMAIGSIAGAGIAMKVRPKRPMVVGVLACAPFVVLMALLIPPAPLAVLLAFGVVQGIGVDIFGVLWDSSLQLNINGAVLARVSAYDYLGSILATPIGLAAVGFIAHRTSVEATIAGATILCGLVVVILPMLKSIRTMRSTNPETP